MLFLRKSLFAAVLIGVTLLPQLQILLSQDVLTPSENRITETASLSSYHFKLFPTAHAQGAGDVSETANMIQEMFSMALHALVLVNWVALATVQTLLDPDTIFGVRDPFFPLADRPMEAVLRSLWVASRNIVNGIFAFILLGAGVMLIVKSNSDMIGKIKSGFPKFVLAVVLVNFSWFFPRVILDVASVLSSVIYELPAIVNPNNTPCLTSPGEQCLYVWKVHFFPPSEEDCVRSRTAFVNHGTREIKGCPSPALGKDPPNRGKNLGIVSIYIDDWNATRADGYEADDPNDPEHMATLPTRVQISGADAVINGLAVNFAKLPQLNEIDFSRLRTTIGDTTSISTIAKAMLRYLMHLIFHVLLSLAIGLALLAFAAVLVVRIAVLWLTIAFMPFAFIGMALGKGLGEIHEKMPVNIWKEFLKYAFYPTLVAIPFAVGFTLMSNLYVYKAFPSPATTIGLDFFPGVDTLHEFLWMVITIGIIWKGVFMILDGDKIAGSMVSTIKGVGEGSMKIAAKTAGYMPIFPLPGGKMQSILGASEATRQIPLNMRNFTRGIGGDGKGSDPMAPPPPKTDDIISGFDPGQFDELKRLLDRVSSARPEDVGTHYEEIVRLMKTKGLSDKEARDVASNPEALKKIAGSAQSAGKIDVGTAGSVGLKLHEFETSMKKIALKNGPLDNEEKHIAEKVADAIKSKVSEADIKKSLQNNKSYQKTAGGQEAIQKVIDKFDDIKIRVDAGEDSAAIAGAITF